MKQHQDLMRHLLDNGRVKGDRTGTGTISDFGGMMKFSLQHGFWPIPTTREVDHEKVSSELEWMLKGIVSVQWLKDRNNGIWNSWMGEQSGTIGPMYGEQWRNFGASIREIAGEDEERLNQILSEAVSCEDYISISGAIEAVKKFVKEKTKLFQDGGRGGVDQLKYIADELRNNPDSRRLVVNVWHAGLLPDLSKSPKENADDGLMALAPCHSTWQVESHDMTEMEILRQWAYEHIDFQKKMKEMIDAENGMSCMELNKQIVAFANVWMNNMGWVESAHPIPMSWQDMKCNPTSKPYDIVADYAFVITEAGQRFLAVHKEKGLPTRALSLLCFARSQDVPLGTVFNVGMYSLLAHLLASMCNMVPWEYTHLMGDHHIYSNQVEKVQVQLKRTPLAPCRVEVVQQLENLEDFDHKQLMVYYKCHEKIVFPRAAV